MTEPVADALADLHVAGLARADSPADWCLDMCALLGASVQVVREPRPLDPARLDELAAAADVLIVDTDLFPAVAGFELSVLLGRIADSGVIVAAFSPYGLVGPLSTRRGSELTVEAVTGIMSTNGYATDPPLQAGVPVTGAAAAALGLGALVAAVVGREADPGRPAEVLDVSQYDVGICLLGTLMPHVFRTDRAPARIGNRHPMSAPWNTYPTANGWAVITVIGEAMWRALAGLVDVDLLTDPRYVDASARLLHRDELDKQIGEWSAQRTTAEVIAATGAVGVPAGDIRTLGEALADAVASGSPIVRRTTEGIRPGLPWRARPVAYAATPSHRPMRSAASGADSGPLVGVRVVEIGSLTSAPLAGRFLAAMGADVLKIEPAEGEMSRHLAQQVDGVGYLYFVNNTDKRDCVLDLRDPVDHKTLLGLLREADVLLTNLAPSSLRRLGLGGSDLQAQFPALVYCSVSGYGSDVRSDNDKAFDTVIQGRSGIMSLTGLADGPPMKTGMSFADVLGACIATAAVTTAIRALRRTGRGQYIDVAMLDAALWTARQRWDAALRQPSAVRRSGNESPTSPLHGVFPCADGSVALDAVDGDGFVRLAAALGVAERIGSAGDVNTAIARAIESRTVEQVAELAAVADTCVAPVLDLAAVAAHEHADVRGLFPEQHGAASEPIRVLGVPVRFGRSPVAVTGPAPKLGAHEPRWSQRSSQER